MDHYAGIDVSLEYSSVGKGGRGVTAFARSLFRRAHATRPDRVGTAEQT
jgi:hypothetical protein